MSRAARKPKTLVGSREAKQAAAVVLEVLSGLRGPSQAAETLGALPTERATCRDHAERSRS